MNEVLAGSSERVATAARRAAKKAKPVWDRVDDLVLRNQKKVLDAFISLKVSATHLAPSTGYGYGDAGRDALDRVYAAVFGAPSAMVRTHWVSGTHVLKTVFCGLLRPGDDLLCVTGAVYETLVPLFESFGGLDISCRQTSCLLDYQEGRLDLRGVEDALEREVSERTKVLFVQRSRGYSARKSVAVETLADLTRLCARRWPRLLTVVDNCYCEFAQDKEPPLVGASLAAGSLIKNPGGGLCPAGGYVAGTEECVRKVAEALYAPGLDRGVGSNPCGYRDMYQGLFLAPRMVGEALKGASFAAAFFEELGFVVDPGPLDGRCDIVQSITVSSPEKLDALARRIQAASPVDSFVLPEAWDMPGYRHKVIMAAGTFIQGSSIELSCDAPFAPPYTAYLQGGLSKEHVILACLQAGEALI